MSAATAVRPALLLAVLAGAGAVAAVAVSLAAGSPRGSEFLGAGVVAAWVVAGVALARRRPEERMAPLLLRGALLGAVAVLAGAVLRAGATSNPAVAGGAVAAARLARPLALALLPPAAMHVLLGLPDGTSRTGNTTIRVAYAVGGAIGVLLWLQRPAPPLWPVALEALPAAAVGLAGSNRRYRRAGGVERQRMQWFGWAVVAAVEVLLVTIAIRLLAGWPQGSAFVAAATLPVPLALAAGASERLLGHIDRLLAHTVSIVGLTGVVIAVYLVIVLGLGRSPTAGERPLLALSMLAAAVAALLYLPARQRLSRFANRFVYGERDPPDEVLRTFGSRLSRAVPLDELLLQVAESLRKTLALETAEVWTGSGGRLDRVVSVPDAPAVHLSLTAEEEGVVARAGVSGAAWARVWLPALLAGREDCVLRVAPATHSGQLLGLIVAVRPPTGERFTEEDERLLTELARQVGLALHNVQLDSALQASLDEVRQQAQELQASRARIVAASDAARRQIERNLHDGAQQHLVALAVNLRLARQVADSDPDTAKEMLDQLSGDLQEAVQQLRTLAHGIYPPLLVDRGLAEALSAAAARAALPTDVVAEDLPRFSPEVEAAVYFCCLEALQNAGKHAGEGASASVRVWQESGALLFEVVDDGAGFDPTDRQGLGAGFVNMNDRVGSIGGSLQVRSAPGEGTRVLGRVPVTTLTPTAPARSRPR